MHKFEWYIKKNSSLETRLVNHSSFFETKKRNSDDNLFKIPQIPEYNDLYKFPSSSANFYKEGLSGKQSYKDFENSVDLSNVKRTTYKDIKNVNNNLSNLDTIDSDMVSLISYIISYISAQFK